MSFTFLNFPFFEYKFFDDVAKGKMILSAVGALLMCCGMKKNHASYIELRKFVVMPNHIHGIIEITDNNTNGADITNNTDIMDANTNMDAINVDMNAITVVVGARHALPLHPQPHLN